MMLRNSDTGQFLAYNISDNQITGFNSIGAVGLEWQFSGIGNFKQHPGNTDMMLRNSNLTGQFLAYNISDNQITGFASIGTVGLEWQFSGIGNFSGIPGESDMILRNTDTGGLPGLQHRQQSVHRLQLHRHGRPRMAVRRRCPNPSPRRLRPGIAQRRHRPIPALQHRQQ